MSNKKQDMSNKKQEAGKTSPGAMLAKFSQTRYSFKHNRVNLT